MRLAAATLAALTALAVLPAAVAAQTCAPRGAEVEAQNRHVRVYSVRQPGQQRNETFSVHYACARATGRTRRLDDPHSGGEVTFASRFLLRGRFVAFEQLVLAETGESDEHIHVLDAVRGAYRVRLVAFRSPGGSEASFLQRFVLKSNGSVAWIANHQLNAVQVRKVDSTTGSRGRTLDTGSASGRNAIGTNSLRLAGRGTRVTWTRGDDRRAAPLR